MHPAYSVILFTTASGAGYGLLALLGVASGFGWLPAYRLLGFVGLGVAFTLITAGLLSSTLHLGHPERAWRALSQWRSSWLSIEGVLAIATYLPAGVLGLGWVLLGRTDGVFALCGVIAAVLAMATVCATGMIYQSLPTIRQWHQPLTAPVYVCLAIATGSVLFALLSAVFGLGAAPVAAWAGASLAIAGALKWLYWRTIDAGVPLASAETATGLGHLGKVRQLDPPHTQANFVMREMGYTIARKHAQKLRALVVGLLFVAPLFGCSLAALSQGMLQIVALAAATLCAAIGVVTERWLFFAEAQHVAMTFYGAAGDLRQG